MRLRVLDDLGAAKLSAISHLDLQDFADRMLANGLDPSTIRNTLMPLRVVFRRAVIRGELAVNPCTLLELPAVRGCRERFAGPEEAAQMIAAVPEADRAIWATAAYAGLRLGELWALEHGDVDLDAGLIHVRRSWDRKEGIIEPKSQAGKRDVSPSSLRSALTSRRIYFAHGGAPDLSSAAPIRGRSMIAHSRVAPRPRGSGPNLLRSACTNSVTVARRSSSPVA